MQRREKTSRGKKEKKKSAEIAQKSANARKTNNLRICPSAAAAKGEGKSLPKGGRKKGGGWPERA